jgi:hypothetical protein
MRNGLGILEKWVYNTPIFWTLTIHLTNYDKPKSIYKCLISVGRDLRIFCFFLSFSCFWAKKFCSFYFRISAAHQDQLIPLSWSQKVQKTTFCPKLVKYMFLPLHLEEWNLPFFMELGDFNFFPNFIFC